MNILMFLLILKIGSMMDETLWLQKGKRIPHLHLKLYPHVLIKNHSCKIQQQKIANPLQSRFGRVDMTETKA
ncbi:unnamed protein product [Callosobruchus maculatus]|uniref:Uncharacterized protein n=1 Tax=Callosobruchus maculatus TaxID=64391 RepID=A0A653BPT0_CALMS|nr:unnamed protein product [Callosobruchus maculatus]